jgi:hypothetical protein
LVEVSLETENQLKQLFAPHFFSQFCWNGATVAVCLMLDVPACTLLERRVFRHFIGIVPFLVNVQAPQDGFL